MISQFAIDAIEALQAEGLSPTPADIVRLNALGLKCANGERAADYIRLPRTSYLGHLVLREPTLGHGEWLDRFLAKVDAADAATLFIATAYALSRRVDDFPDVDDVPACAKAVRAFAKKDLRNLTLAQIRSAVDYAVVGVDPAARERPASDTLPNDDESVPVGRLFDTASIGLGLSVADIRRMRPLEVDYITERAFQRIGIDIAKHAHTNRLGEFYDTLNAIKARLSASQPQPPTST